MFRSYEHKRLRANADLLQKFWNELSYGEQTEFRQKYFGIYLTIMSITNWNGTIQ